MAQVTRNLSTAGAWSVNPGCAGVTLVTGDTCPFFPDDPVYQQRLLDEQRASFDPLANERNDLQDGTITRGAERGFESAFKLIEYPSNLSSASWHLIGCTGELHGNGLPQAVLQPQLRVSTGVGTQGLGNTLNRNASLPAGEPRLWIDTNSGQEPHRYYDLGPIALNTWTYIRMHLLMSTGSNGFIRVYRDGDTSPRVNLSGANTGGSGDYWKLPNYRNRGQSGATTFRWAGCREWDGLMPNRATGAPPPPSGEDVTPPSISITTPIEGATYTNLIPFNVTVTDASDLSNVWIGLGGNPIPAQAYVNPSPGVFTGSLNVSELTPGDYFFYAAAQDSAGNLNQGTPMQVTVAAPTSGFQAISGGVIARSDVTGTLTPAATTAITSVIQRGETEVVYKIPRFYEVFADGTFGAEVVWNSSTGQFEYAA